MVRLKLRLIQCNFPKPSWTLLLFAWDVNGAPDCGKRKCGASETHDPHTEVEKND